MRELRLILGLARREALQRARSRAFRISTAFILLAALGAVAIPALVVDGETAYSVGVVGEAPAGFEQAVRQNAGDDTSVEFEQFADREAGEEALREELDVLVTADPVLVWDGRPDAGLQAMLSSSLSRLELAERAQSLGIPPDQLESLLAPLQIESQSLDPEEGAEERGPRALIATAGMVLLFVSITFYGSYILMSVIEEKQNRVVEILLAHVEPRDLLAAKVLGHGALGLAQITAVVIIGLVGVLAFDLVEVPTATVSTFLGVLMWFILGFAFYSIAYGALGSLVSRTEDAQSAVGPLTITLMAAYIASFTIVGNPGGALAVAGSFFPPTAPLMMPIRSALTDVPVWQVLVAVVIMVAAIVGFVRLGGRLYRGAVLHIGPKMSIREAWQATR